ncbi:MULTISPECIES: hypothetical protein [unclassified Variovorax]|uniref:hypothetical protein n=1 Tax=unclassified Variovorax TaxID=663243 RepID=UPI001160BD4B|nr:MULTISPECIES: hypothetical protein [unclassified Variovorax]
MTWLSSLWNSLRDEKSARLATVVSALLTLGTAGVALAALLGTQKVNRADHRDRTFANVISAAQAVVAQPDLAPRLFLTLHAAAQNIDEGLLTPDDANLLGIYLNSEASLKGRPEVCRAWNSLPLPLKSDVGLARLADQAIRFADCKSLKSP